MLVTALTARPILTAAPSPAHKIIGSWMSQPTFSGARQPGAPVLITFTADGLILWSGHFGGISGGHGTWAGAGDLAVTGTFIYLRRNSGGDFIGTIKVRSNYTLNATYDEFTGSGKVDFLDAQGKMVRSADFTVHATRIKIESP